MGRGEKNKKEFRFRNSILELFSVRWFRFFWARVEGLIRGWRGIDGGIDSCMVKGVLSDREIFRNFFQKFLIFKVCRFWISFEKIWDPRTWDSHKMEGFQNYFS